MTRNDNMPTSEKVVALLDLMDNELQETADAETRELFDVLCAETDEMIMQYENLQDAYVELEADRETLLDKIAELMEKGKSNGR